MKECRQKKLLILATYFPPAPEIAAARLKSIIKYLLRLDWEIHAVAATDPHYDYSKDEVLGNVCIHSAGAVSKSSAVSTFPLPAFIKKQIKSARNIVKIFKWSRKAFLLSLRIIRSNSIGTVLATVPGIEALSAASRIKRAIPGIRLFCEYRDIISGNQIYNSIHSPIETIFASVSEARALSKPDNFIFLTESIKNEYMQYISLNPAIRDGIVLTNGYDPELYPFREACRLKKDTLVITHTGHMYGSRDPVTLAAAAAELFRENPAMGKKIEIYLVGKMDAGTKGKILEICIKNTLANFFIMDPVSHEEAIALMSGSDINLIITHTCGSGYALPGKLFEYIGAGRPVWAITTDPLLVKLILDEDLGWVCPNKPQEIKNCLCKIYKKWLEGAFEARSAISKYDRRNIVYKLDRFLLSERKVDCCRREEK